MYEWCVALKICYNISSEYKKKESIDYMVYDTVICVSPEHKYIAIKAIKSLHLFTESKKIFVITSHDNFDFFQNKLNNNFPITLIDENTLIDKIELNIIKNILIDRIGSPQRAGWYFQQFLKMSASTLPEIENYYLIWDSDTILLHPIDFFDQNGKVLINPKTEHHKPYFKLLDKVLDIQKQVDFSFISEHLMVNKFYMKELIDLIQDRFNNELSWVEIIINSIDNKDLGGSGFSEYEFYGNYIASRHKNSYMIKPLKSLRDGTKFYGSSPSKYDLCQLMRNDFVFVTFEIWQTMSARQSLTSKIKSLVYCLFKIDYNDQKYKISKDILKNL